MISILIPTYNYVTYPLVFELHKQCLEYKIEFEIICMDDASPNPKPDNFKINDLTHCRFQVLDKNIGRSAIRNLLVQKAKYNWLLFLDADTFPMHNHFIRNYILEIDNNEKVVYGGIQYQTEQPKKDELLRWVYGKNREALSVKQRKQNPYLSFLTLHFLISKSVFEKVPFNENIPNLRHEDTLFSFNLKQNNITIHHIENPALHLGLENSETFLKKSEESIIGLKFLLDHQLIAPEYLKISKIYSTLEKIGLKPLVSFGFKCFKKIFKKQLLGNSPSLFLFDLYRLGYLYSLKS